MTRPSLLSVTFQLSDSNFWARESSSSLVMPSVVSSNADSGSEKIIVFGAGPASGLIFGPACVDPMKNCVKKIASRVDLFIRYLFIRWFLFGLITHMVYVGVDLFLVPRRKSVPRSGICLFTERLSLPIHDQNRLNVLKWKATSKLLKAPKNSSAGHGLGTTTC